MTVVRGCVYVYIDSNGLNVYIGQTRQLPTMRDKAHRKDTVTPFDRSYDEDGKYITGCETGSMFQSVQSVFGLLSANRGLLECPCS